MAFVKIGKIIFDSEQLSAERKYCIYEAGKRIDTELHALGFSKSGNHFINKRLGIKIKIILTNKKAKLT